VPTVKSRSGLGENGGPERTMGNLHASHHSATAKQ
jgi:hypothetical protein